MQIELDGNNNKFFRFKNVRVSVKHSKGPDQDWEGTGRYLQILAYRNAAQQGTYPGPQIPIKSNLADEEILAVIWATLHATACLQQEAKTLAGRLT